MKKKQTKSIEDELRKIYEDASGKMPDLTKLEDKRGSSLTRLLGRAIVVLLVACAIAWGGFFLWRPFSLHTTRPLSGTIQGPETATVGESVTYHVRYENTSRVPIAALEVKMNLPQNFVLQDTRPEATDGARFLIGSLSPGSDGSIDLTGTFRSAVPSTEKLQAFFTYRPANFSSDFQDIASHSVNVEKTVLKLEASGPDKALPGDTITYTARLVNEGSARMDLIRLRAVLPETFRVLESTPQATSENGTTWDIGSLDPGATFDLTLKGSFTTGESGTLQATFETGLLDPEGVFLTQASSVVATDMLGGNLAVHLIANGSDQSQSLDPGSDVRVSIDYGNEGNEVLEGVAFTLLFETDGKSLPIDWAAMDAGGGKQQGNMLLWDSATHPSLARLEPSASGVIDVTLPLLSHLDSATHADSFTMKLSATLQKVGSVESARTIEVPPIDIRMNTDASFAASARYYDEDGTTIGSGALPPRVDETTTYRIFWSIKNTLHDLERVSVSVNLPPDVSWTERAKMAIGSIAWNPTTRLVTWTIEKLPTAVPAADAWFDVAITPDASDVGTFMKLTNVTAFEGVDAVTKDTVHASIDVLDTELPADAQAAGKGVVID